METPSLLVTFQDERELNEEHRTKLSNGRAVVYGEYPLSPGETCEVVIVHPETGESMPVDAKVESIDDDEVNVRFAVTPMIRNRLDKFMGFKDVSNIQARVRLLKGSQRRQLALTGDLTERTALERAFGREVWEALLENPRLTIGEVVRLARNGAIPLPMLEKIAQNNTWVKVPQIRRALFANRHTDSKMIQRLLRFTPGAELRLLPNNTAYPMSVRQAANRLLGKK